MLNDRRKLVLKTIIDEFIETAAPVGSKSLIKKYNIPFSSATIRNDMMNLEELGLLEKTHTSSGRIPSEDGYKFYIDNLIGRQTVNQQLINDTSDDERSLLLEKLVRTCYQHGKSFDEKIKEIIKVINEITDYTVFYLGPSLDRTTVSQIRLVQLSQYEVLILLITDLGKIETKIIPVKSLEEIVVLDNIVKYLNEMLTGVSLSDLCEKMSNDIQPILSKHIQSYDRFHQSFIDFFASFIGSATYFSGQLNMITENEDMDFAKIKKIFSFFEDERAMQWFKSEVPGIDVHIGEEIFNELFKDYAIIRLTFNMQTKGYGTIGIIGPKRMHYNDIIQLLVFVNQFIDKGGQQ